MDETTPPATSRSNASSGTKATPLELPPELIAALAAMDTRRTAFHVREVRSEIARVVPDWRTLAPHFQRGAWAEQIAFAFTTRRAADGGAWGTYFQPSLSETASDGAVYHSPNLDDVGVEVLAHWAARAKTAQHSVLVARYADLVWDVSPWVTKAKRSREAFECSRLAIDRYIAASKIDDGTVWHETSDNLARALNLAAAVDDPTRIAEAVRANIDFVERTADDARIRAYCFLFDNLFPQGRAPQLAPEQERAVIDALETKLAKMTTPGSAWEVDPFEPRDVGMRLASYYERKGLSEDRSRVIRAVGGAFERRAKIGNPLVGVMDLKQAREFYALAGLRSDAERVQLEAQRLGPEAEKHLVPTTVYHEIPKEDVESFLNAITKDGLEHALQRLVVLHLPEQGEVARTAEDIAKDHPMYELFVAASVQMAHGHIEADIGDSAGDPDGLMVHRTAQALQLQAPWISWVFERLVRDGLTPSHVLAFVEKCPLFRADRLKLVRQGVEAHFVGDYVQAIHVLIPQIEHGIVSLAPLSGKPSNKPHRTGRGVMQFKSLDDMLARNAWPIAEVVGENLRMYFRSALAHPKGLNIRNDVCHGLWAAANFTRTVSERVLHVLLSLSLLRTAERADSSESKAPPDEVGDDANAGRS